jgi:hypothetical protein
MSVLLSLLAGWAVLRAFGADHRWPWRVLDLVEGDLIEPDVLEGDDAAHVHFAPRPLDRQSPGSRSVRRGARGRRFVGSAGTARPRPARQRRLVVRSGRARRRSLELERDLPATVDLLQLAVSAGHSLHTAVAAVAEVGTGPASRALAGAVERHERGARLVESLEELPSRHGAALWPLTTTLCVAVSSGAPLGPALQRLADAERRRLRRRTEERVRRLPVLLLAPLVGLILPAFVLLTVVPVALTTARAGLDPLDAVQVPAGRLPTDGPAASFPSPVDQTRNPP